MSNEEENPFNEKFLASIRPESELRRMLILGDKAKALIKHEKELRRPLYSVLTFDGNTAPKFYGVFPFPDIMSYERVTVRDTFDTLTVVEDKLGQKKWNERNYIEAVEQRQILPSMRDVAYGRRRIMPVKGKPEIKCVRPLPDGRIKYRTKPSSRKWEIIHSDGKREKVDKEPDDVLYWDIKPSFSIV